MSETTSPSTPAYVTDELDRFPTARIMRLARKLRRAFDEQLVPHGLTSVQFGLLNRLASADGLVQAELSRRMAIEPATLTGILQRLERDGWLRRSCDANNRRLQRVWLTEKARAELEALRRLQERHRRRSLGGLTPGDLIQLEILLDRIEANLA
jgi:DNA-binding MarR family transcriptional regulator